VTQSRFKLLAAPRDRKMTRALLLLSVLAFAPALAQEPGILLVNGRIYTLDATSTVAEALAIRGERILAVGSIAAIRQLTGKTTRVIDLGGRTVIPGLIDSHMHAIRAALSFSTEVNWIGAKSIREAMVRVSERARALNATLKPDGWLIVAGGWTPEQFEEKRVPTQAELDAAALDHPAYVQLFYSRALMSAKGLAALGIRGDKDAPPAGKLERDANGPTGWIAGNTATITALFARLPKPSFDEQVEGTKKFFAELNRLALTGVVDPGGFGMSPPDYQALFKVWRGRELSVRVAYTIFAQGRGRELDDYKNLTQLLPMGFGDSMLRFNGIGENVAWSVYNNDDPPQGPREQFYEICRWAAGQGMALNIHWHNDKSVGVVLDIFERVNRETPITDLRWAIAHLEDASAATLARMKALGVGWALQDAGYFEGEQQLKEKGEQAMKRIPAMNTALKTGVHVGAGTDAHRVMSYNPWAALRWMLDGKTVGGRSLRGPEETPTREDALRMYTSGSAWFAFAEGERGSLEPGKLADLAVLSKDYFKAPLEEIGSIESLMTVVGGQVVHATAPYLQVEQR
jgi:predicted amidohydrolase YtcJ